MPLSVRDSGVWRTAANVYAKAGGVWRQAKNVWVNVAGVWKLVYYRFTGTTTYVAGQSGQWTVPPNTYTVEVTVVGGGGGAGASNENDGSPTYGSGGGGSGGYQVRVLQVTPGQQYAFSVGAGGVGKSSPANGSIGDPGQNSVFGAYTSTGGGGGKSGSYQTNAAGASGTPSEQLTPAQKGYGSATQVHGGDGGSNPLGTGGLGGENIVFQNGGNGTGYGSGGGGAGARQSGGSHPNGRGGNGAGGVVIIKY